MTVKLSLFPGCFPQVSPPRRHSGCALAWTSCMPRPPMIFPASQSSIHRAFDDWRLFLGHMSYLDGTVTSYFS